MPCKLCSVALQLLSQKSLPIDFADFFGAFEWATWFFFVGPTICNQIAFFRWFLVEHYCLFDTSTRHIGIQQTSHNTFKATWDNKEDLFITIILIVVCLFQGWDGYRGLHWFPSVRYEHVCICRRLAIFISSMSNAWLICIVLPNISSFQNSGLNQGISMFM